ncbi:MAG: hypothetical protein U1E05_08270, partial [Patescibacteria group bacterium]|nr:hypothetical protein [Patescibacteria group bacterium]
NDFGLTMHDDSKGMAGAGGGKTHPPRSRRQETIRQASIIALLVLAVGTLVGVFMWVVYYSPSS